MPKTRTNCHNLTSVKEGHLAGETATWAGQALLSTAREEGTQGVAVRAQRNEHLLESSPGVSDGVGGVALGLQLAERVLERCLDLRQPRVAVQEGERRADHFGMRDHRLA